MRVFAKYSAKTKTIFPGFVGSQMCTHLLVEDLRGFNGWYAVAVAGNV